MVESVHQPAQRTVEFGIYRDGDNNLDLSQGITLRQALQSSEKDSRVEYTVEDTTSVGTGRLRTDSFTLADGGVSQAQIDAPHDMASEKNLAQFVAQVLDNAEKAGAKQTWIELTDHGAGDGGGLEADSARQIMPMPKIAQAVADGVKLHAQEHPEDADRRVEGVVANQCLMASLGFAEGYYISRAKRPVLLCLARSAACAFGVDRLVQHHSARVLPQPGWHSYGVRAVLLWSIGARTSFKDLLTKKHITKPVCCGCRTIRSKSGNARPTGSITSAPDCVVFMARTASRRASREAKHRIAGNLAALDTSRVTSPGG